MRPISRRTRVAAAAAAVTASLVLAGCGTADPNAQESSSSEPATPTSPKSTSQPAPTTTTSTSTSTTTSRTPTTTSTTQTPTRTRTFTRTQTPTRTETRTATPTPTRTSAPPTLADDGKELTLGASSPRVLAAQKRLQSLGYFIPEPDGSFGGGTRQAVWAIQKVAGLPRTGKIDAATKRAIDNGVRGNPTISNGLEINLGRQVMYVVRGGALQRTINISSGNGETFRYAKKKDKDGKVTEWGTTTAVTPAGSYSIGFERDYNHKSTLELGSMYRPKYFNGAIAVHGSGSVPAYPASHGCVRVANPAMDWLWSSGMANMGTSVYVR
jgi:peptidoglycan hydrolase-like protein with peptidoglycan-binding domain